MKPGIRQRFLEDYFHAPGSRSHRCRETVIAGMDIGWIHQHHQPSWWLFGVADPHCGRPASAAMRHAAVLSPVIAAPPSWGGAITVGVWREAQGTGTLAV